MTRLKLLGDEGDFVPSDPVRAGLFPSPDPYPEISAQNPALARVGRTFVSLGLANYGVTAYMSIMMLQAVNDLLCTRYTGSLAHVSVGKCYLETIDYGCLHLYSRLIIHETARERDE